MNPRKTYCFLLIATLFTGSCSQDGDDPAPRAKHLLFISVDTLRKDRLGCYGGPNKPSPNIDRLAEEGTLFMNAFTSRGMTLPSFATFFTSKYPTQHGVIDNLKQIPGREVTLAERLKGAGFHNRAFNASGVLRPGRGNVEQGYDPKAYTYIDDDRQISARAEFYLKNKFGMGDRREYLWVHFMEPHKPYVAPSSYARKYTDPDYDGPYDGSGESIDPIYVDQLSISDADRRHIEGLYDGTIAFVDDCIGRVLDALEESGHAEDTLVIFASDHGEELGSHNGYYYHANSLYSATTGLAFIGWQRGTIPPQQVEGLVENTDFMPTVLAWLGVDPAEGGGSASDLEGHDLSPVLLGTGSVQRDFSVAFVGTYDFDDDGTARGMFSARNLDWHYVSNPCGRTPGYPPAGRDFFIPREQLFHVAEDPDEQVDRAGDDGHDQAKKALQAAIDLFKAKYVDQATEIPKDSMTIEKIETLMQLGYLDMAQGQKMIQQMKRMRDGKAGGHVPEDEKPKQEGDC